MRSESSEAGRARFDTVVTDLSSLATSLYFSKSLDIKYFTSSHSVHRCEESINEYELKRQKLKIVVL